MSQDYYFLANRISNLEKLVEELMERLNGQEYWDPAAYEDWDEQEICNAHSRCERIIRVQSNIINNQEGME